MRRTGLRAHVGTRSGLSGIHHPAAVLSTTRPLRYWQGSRAIALILFAVIAVRVAELHPLLTRVRPALLVGFISALLLGLRTDRRVRREALHDPSMVAALVYFAICVASILTAMWKRVAYDTVQGMAFALLGMFAFLMVRPARMDYDRVRRGMVYICAAYGALVSAVGRMDVGESTRLTTGGMLDPNDLAAIMAPIVPLAMYSAIRERGPRRLLGILAVIPLILTVARTGSRGGAIALFVGVVVYVTALDARRTLMACALAVVGAFGMWHFGPQTFRDRVATLTSMESDYNVTESHDGRLAIWRRALGYYADRPILGVGPNNMPEADGRRLRELGVKAGWRAAHNAYLQAFTEVGTLGGIAFLYMVASGVSRAARLWRRQSLERRPEVLAMLLAYCAAITFLSHAYSYMLFALIGFTALASRTFQSPAACRLPGYGSTVTQSASGA